MTCLLRNGRKSEAMATLTLKGIQGMQSYIGLNRRHRSVKMKVKGWFDDEG